MAVRQVGTRCIASVATIILAACMGSGRERAALDAAQAYFNFNSYYYA